jgi:hypothetical protein
MRMLSDHVGVSSNGVVASPKSAAEAAVEDRIVREVRGLLTADFLAQCAVRPQDLKWFLDLLESSRDRVQRSRPK